MPRPQPIFAYCVLAALCALASARARAGDATFADVPRVTAQDPAFFRAIFERARTEQIRMAIFGDSQETAPNGWGTHYLAHINAGFARIYGPTSETSLFSNTTCVAIPQWLATTHASSAVATSVIPPAAFLPGVSEASFLLAGNGLTDAHRSVLLHDASQCVDPALENGAWFDRTGPFVAEVLAIAQPKSPGIRWSNAPTDSDSPDATSAVVQSGLFQFNRKTPAGTHVWFTTPPLDFAGRAHLQLALSGNSASVGTEVVGVRYRSLSAARGITVQAFSEGGLRLLELTQRFGESGAQLRDVNPQLVVLHYGANDVANGITEVQWRQQLLDTIAWIRAAMKDPIFPIIIAAEQRIGNAAAQAEHDRLPVIAHELALADSHVLALNLMRATSEEYGWGPRGDLNWTPYLADSAHYQPYGQRLLAAAFVGSLRSALAIDDPSCTPANWADCVRVWGAYCAFGGCARVIDQDVIAANLEWGGPGSSCDDADSDGYPDLCPPQGDADINHDGMIDAGDLAMILGAWGSDNADADLNDDGLVGAEDLAEFLAAWNG